MEAYTAATCPRKMKYTCWCGKRHHTINNKGLIIDENDGSSSIFTPRAFTKAEDIGVVDLAIVFVKSIMTEAAMEANKALIGKDTIVMTLQNGYGNGDDIMKFVPKEQVIIGTTGHGCTIKGPGHIFHAGQGPTHRRDGGPGQRSEGSQDFGRVRI